MSNYRKIRSNKGKKRKPYKTRVKRHPNGRKVRSNKGVKRGQYKKNNSEECVIMDINNNKIILPKEYPGDEWVHQHLVPRRDVDLKYYQLMRPDVLSNTYHQYKNMCNN